MKPQLSSLLGALIHGFYDALYYYENYPSSIKGAAEGYEQQATDPGHRLHEDAWYARGFIMAAEAIQTQEQNDESPPKS